MRCAFFVLRLTMRVERGLGRTAANQADAKEGSDGAA
jgi:hypothetical protein